MTCSQKILYTFLGLISISLVQSDTFHEELMLKPLYLMATFMPTFNSQHYGEFRILQKHVFKHTHFFPRGLAEIIGRHSVEELHITLTEGLWNYVKYGYPFYSAGPGTEITAWFNKNVTDVDQEWKGLTNALSGLLCASLNFVNPSNSLSPEFSFRPTGVVSEVPKSSHLRYSSLPRETACTENLTPFKKY